MALLIILLLRASEIQYVTCVTVSTILVHVTFRYLLNILVIFSYIYYFSVLLLISILLVSTYFVN